MPLLRPSRDEIIARIRADVQASLGTGPILERSILGVLTKALAGSVHLLHGSIEWASRQPFADTAELEFLERQGGLFGITRKAATFARGSITISGLDGSGVAGGRKLRRSDGFEYQTDARATIAGGTAQVSITATVAGEAGNAPASTPLVFVQSTAGVQSTALVSSAGLVGGLAGETDEELRDRVLQRLREPPTGGSASDYRRWALEVPGVTRAWVQPQAMGPGTVGVTFTTDTASTGAIPTPTKLVEVQAYLDARRPVTAQVVAYAPIARVVPISLRLTPNTAAVRAAVSSALVDLFRREAEPGAPLLVSHVREAVSGAAGETDSVLTYPTADVVPLVGELPVLGLVEFL